MSSAYARIHTPGTYLVVGNAWKETTGSSSEWMSGRIILQAVFSTSTQDRRPIQSATRGSANRFGISVTEILSCGVDDRIEFSVNGNTSDYEMTIAVSYIGPFVGSPGGG